MLRLLLFVLILFPKWWPMEEQESEALKMAHPCSYSKSRLDLEHTLLKSKEYLPTYLGK